MTSLTGNRGPIGQFKDKVPHGYGVASIQQYTPQQMGLHEQQFQHVGPESYLNRLAGGDQSLFTEMEAPAHRQFAEKIGGLASRFSGIGTGGRHSSGFQNTATAAGSNFAQDLASRRQELQRQAIMDLMGLSNQLLNQRPYERTLYEKPQKQSWLGALAPLAGAGIGGLFGGPAGASFGGQIGSSFSAGLSGQQYQPDFSGVGNLGNSWKDFFNPQGSSGGYNRLGELEAGFRSGALY